MIPVYAIFVVLGFFGVLGWVYLGITASSVDGKETFDPEARYGAVGRYIVAGALGFGLGGMSASFAGWAAGFAVVGAFAGAALMVVAARYLGVEGGSDEDPA